MSYTMTARYASRCNAGCGAPIDVGDRIVWDPDESAARHLMCEPSLLLDRPIIACPTCFLAKPCPCDDDQ